MEKLIEAIAFITSELGGEVVSVEQESETLNV